jgi:outer membrane protein assembly factor BamB
MVCDSVVALDADTGEQRWEFFAEGPVRFAPIAWQDKVYFVSDDGYLYCVDAADGRLLWKFQGLPAGQRERKILGNRRLISLWPAWGGPVLHDGVLYFGCGLWSAYGVSIHALDAQSGRAVWTNATANHIARGNMDHGIANEAGLTPQGYLAVVNGKLVVPCGAQLPAFLDLKTGALDTYCMGWGGRNGLPKGTWFVAGASHFLSHGGDLYDIARANDELLLDPRFPLDFKRKLYPGALLRLKIERTNLRDVGEFSQPVFAGDVMYESTPEGLVAQELATLDLQERNKATMPAHRRDDPYPDKVQGVFRQQWSLPSDRRVHIKAGAHLYLGGPGVVEAVRIPPRGEEPRVAWRASIDGTPHRLLAADGKLFVVTREGSLLAFGGKEQARPVVLTPTMGDPSPTDAWTKAAADMLEATKVRDGYALVLGFDSGRLIQELVRQSDLFVIAVGRDAAQAAELRRRLGRAGWYGTRASVHVGDPLTYPLPPYLASLVVSENWPAVGSFADRKVINSVFHPLRPYGGTACVPATAAGRESLAKLLADSGLRGAAHRQVGDWVLLSRDGALPGAADWTHAEADAGNTGASTDLVRTPLELLWFDTPKRWLRAPGSTLVRVCAGRMLIKAERLHAIDVFTGRRLWETEFPWRHNAGDQLVALEDAIYVTGGTTCLVLDPATGRKSGQIELPAGLKGAWANLRAWQGYLVAQSGLELVCLNRRGGELVWKHHCGRPPLSVAVGGKKVCCAELGKKPPEGTSGQDPLSYAFDIETGKLLWQAPSDGEVRYSAALDVVVTSTGIHRAADGTLVARLPEPPKLTALTKPVNIPKPLLVVGPHVLFGTAENLALYDLSTGQRTGAPIVWTRRGCTVPRASANLITTRVRGNAACIDLVSRDILTFWNVRAACSNNLFPADGVLNVPSLTGGCTCNYTPVSQAFVPASAFARP